MDDSSGYPEGPASGDESFDHLPGEPKRRTPFVVPEKQKRKFNDGTANRSHPSKRLRAVVNKIRKKYPYQPLTPDQDIRVLILAKGEGSQAVRCMLMPTALPSTDGRSTSVKIIKYEALSYYWGEEEPDIEIIITKYNAATPLHVDHKRFWIRPNLHAALRQLRSPTEDVALWVDAICINQENPDEKTKQVSRMNEIYSEAHSVCIWLGESGDSESDQLLFRFIREILNLRRLDQLVLSESHAPQWFAFVQLMRNRWFSRRWVVQELALSKEATVHYGKEVIQWTDFRDAVALFVTKHDQINSLLVKSRYSSDPDPVGDMRALGANTLVEVVSNLFRRSDNGKILERLLDLETLVSTLLAFEATTDPRDTVYAVLSIAKDTPYSDPNSAAQAVSSPSPHSPESFDTEVDRRIAPNYEKSLMEVCSDFIEYCIEKSNSLDIICRHWAPVPKKPMPSWISLISGSAFGEPEAALQGRSNGDSLVGVPSLRHQKSYNASAGLAPAAEIGRYRDGDGNAGHEEQPPQPLSTGGHTGIHGPEFSTSHAPDKLPKCNGILSAKGMILDTIDQLSPRAPQGMILQESLDMIMGGWNDDYDLEKVPDLLWRILVADRGPRGSKAPSWYYRACLECLTMTTQNGDLSTGALIEAPNTPTTMVSFLKRVQQVVWNRKFLRSRGGPHKREEKKVFGLAPTGAQIGDHICILFGCSVPVILREVRTQSDVHYTLIGESYIHGMMDGEALTKVSPKYPYHGFDEFIIK